MVEPWLAYRDLCVKFRNIGELGLNELDDLAKPNSFVLDYIVPYSNLENLAIM